MARIKRILLVVLCLTALTASPVVATSERLPDPFDQAGLVPASVTQYISVIEVGRLLEELRASNLAPGLVAFFERSPTAGAWSELAGAVQMEPEVLFERMLSRRVTLVTDQPVRGRARPEPNAGAGQRRPRSSSAKSPFEDWVLIAEVDRGLCNDLVRSLNARVTSKAGRTAILAADGGSLRFAHRRGRLYLASAGAEELLNQMLSDRCGPSLADDPDFREARQAVGLGQIGSFARQHAEGPWRIVSARLKSGEAQCTVVTRHAPQPRPQRTCDAISAALVNVLSDGAALVAIERLPGPCTTTDKPHFGATLSPLMTAAQAVPGLMECVGPTVFVRVGASGLDAAGMLGGLDIAFGVELRDAEEGAAMLDGVMLTVVGIFGAEGDARPPAVANLGEEPGKMRRVDLGPACAESRHPGFGGLRPTSLAWSCSTSGDRTWWVAGSDEANVREIHERLASAKPTRGTRFSVARGEACGRSVAAMMDRWPSLDANAGKGRHGQIHGWRELARHVRDVRWHVRRPTTETTRASIIVSW